MDNENLTPLQRAQLKMQQMLESGVLLRSPVQRFVEDPRIGRAIKMFCYECQGCSRKLANECENSDCALWLFRRGRSNADEQELATWKRKYRDHMIAVHEYDEPATEDEPDEIEEDETEEEEAE